MVKRYNGYSTGIPRHEIEALARALLPAMQVLYESEEGKREFSEWRAKQKAEDIAPNG